MTVGIEDCIAMSEDGDWYAFSRECNRNQVMAAIARQADGVYSAAWAETFAGFKVRAGFVTKIPDHPEGEWHEQCEADTPDAIPAWIVSQR